jgi:acylphosphatase
VDGRVELVAEGEPGELNRFVDAIGQTMSHYIQRIHADTAVASGEFDGFEIRF